MTKILAMDVDLTLTKEECWTAEECLDATPNQEMIEKMEEIFHKWYIVISTARRMDRLAVPTLKWLYANHVPFNGIDFRKTACDILIDDKAFRPEEFLKMDLMGSLYDREP